MIYRASKKFTLNGVHYIHGEEVDVSGVDPRRVQTLLATRMLHIDAVGPSDGVTPETTKESTGGDGAEKTTGGKGGKKDR